MPKAVPKAPPGIIYKRAWRSSRSSICFVIRSLPLQAEHRQILPSTLTHWKEAMRLSRTERMVLTLLGFGTRHGQP